MNVTRLLASLAVAAGVCAAPLALAGDEPAHVTEAAGESSTIDWTRGLIIQRAAGAGNIRAPSAAVARVESHREALAAATAQLGARARALVLADGTAVSVAASSSAEIGARLDRAIERALELRTVYSTDGSVMVWVGLPLESVRQAIAGPRAAAMDGHSPITAIVVDASAVLRAPALGISLSLGSEIYQGPTVFLSTAAAAAADPRLGARSVTVAADRYENGILHLEAAAALDADQLAEARATGALVLVVLGT